MDNLISKEESKLERLTYRDSDGRALLTSKGMKIYCSTQATADILCKYEELLNMDLKDSLKGDYEGKQHDRK